MSSREKSLLNLLLIAALVAGLFLGYKNFYAPKYKSAQRQLKQSEQQQEVAKTMLQDRDLIITEQEWLSANEPVPITQQAAQSELQATCEENATGAGLEIKKQTPLASIQVEGSFYHRARMEMLVSGLESNFYNWVSTLDSPAEFRRITYLRINPMRDDDTQVEAQAIIEQWYVPETDNPDTNSES